MPGEAPPGTLTDGERTLSPTKIPAEDEEAAKLVADHEDPLIVDREAPSSILVEDESATEQDAIRDGNSKMSDKPTTEMPTDEERVETPAVALPEGENASI